ncbi:MAG: hypothetical protein K2Y37_01625 [Pirellulales bacterium]|nr:hypothetical protein [Pirellulales bacterium]
MSARGALELLCEKYRSRIFASDAIDWAVAELIEASDSDSLRRLAATLKPTDWWEVDPLLRASFAELGYPWLGETDCYWACAEATDRDIVEDRISPADGCARMYKLYAWLQYPTELRAWDFLHGGFHPDEARELLSGEFDEVVKTTAAAWLRTRPLAPE